MKKAAIKNALLKQKKNRFRKARSESSRKLHKVETSQYCLITDSDLATGQVVNQGEIRFEGEAKAACYIGGNYGQLWAGGSAPAINVGNIYAIGKVDATKTVRIGGYLGYCNYGDGKRSYKNSQVYCDITAYCEAEDGTVTSPWGIGMFTGGTAARISTNSENNKIGGRIATDKSGNWLTINETNYADYVLGDRNSGVTFAKISYLASKDSIVWGDYGNN